MSAYPQLAPIPREIPTAAAHALPASIERLPTGGARITIGLISSVYAESVVAATIAHLKRLESEGRVRIQHMEGAPC